MQKMGKLGIIGAGNMGSAMIGGLVGKGIFAATDINVHDIDEEKVKTVKQSFGTNTGFDSNAMLVQSSDVVLLAVKPQVLGEVLNEIANFLADEKLVVSIVAGISLDTYEKRLGKGIAVARVMPNTPALISAGISCVAYNRNVTDPMKEKTMAILSSVGSAHEVPEKYMDAVTAMSGSGPAYLFTFLEAMIDAGVYLGLPRDLSTALASETILGSIKLAIESKKHPAQLRDQVSSPGGTTVEALHVLDKEGFKGIVKEAIMAAARKSEKLSSN